MQKLTRYVWLLWLATNSLWAQNPIIHSHNDYEQQVPFWNAYAAGARSIEADVILKNNTLYVAHAESEIQETRTMESLYLAPIQKGVAMGMITEQPLQLLLDIKTDAKKTLKLLVQTLEKYPSVLAQQQITYVISGNQPEPKKFKDYPEYVQFDYQALEPLTDEEWNHVGMISLNYKRFAGWNGKGRFTKEDLAKVKEVIEKAHSYHKPFRFWATPDSKSAWKAFTDLGVDYINTDMPFQCVNYVRSLPKRVYTNTVFSEVYTPTYEYDQTEEAVKNVILLIGDGNGLSEISAATLANGGELTLTQLKSIGFIKTSSSDDFTTDSAAAGTAIAIGQKTYNRAIGVDSLGNAATNICEVLQAQNYNTAVISTDEITGATPSAFYAHQKDRGMNQEIAADLYKSQLTLFAAGGRKYFQEPLPFTIVDTPEAIANTTAKHVGYFMAEGGVPSVLNGRGEAFPDVVANSLVYLGKQEQPFFAMIEGAQIDTHGHFNDVSGIVAEGIDFDKAITKAIQFADTHPGTLIIVTADHETSGFSIPQGNLENHVIEGDFTTHDHTATMVPVFAYGPHSQDFMGVYENNEIYHKILKLLNL
ncbi:alkaline phosphatase [Pustulibacterium marinum]|uniref:Alkaline phosphatase n=1 Tax=Pustulibacterium marinum TaxID=1224947 RepID=A0A1I7FV16_9FLAO|nr:alkaline phosphatase [Pustulibacterium marinum]SFU40028.1 alkaline phosphatase [Pustulibacterium marinum]